MQLSKAAAFGQLCAGEMATSGLPARPAKWAVANAGAGRSCALPIGHAASYKRREARRPASATAAARTRPLRAHMVPARCSYCRTGPHSCRPDHGCGTDSARGLVHHRGHVPCDHLPVRQAAAAARDDVAEPPRCHPVPQARAVVVAQARGVPQAQPGDRLLAEGGHTGQDLRLGAGQAKQRGHAPAAAVVPRAQALRLHHEPEHLAL